jgi:hypothetical protein
VISGYWFAAAGTTAGVKAPKRIYVYGADRQWWDLTLPGFTSQSYDPVTSNWTACTSMPTPRINVGVAVVADLVYVIRGETLMIGSNAHASVVNEQYTPIGYEIPALSSPSPSPTTSPAPSPTQSPELQRSELSPTTWIAATVASVAVVGVGLIVYFKKRKN